VVRHNLIGIFNRNKITRDTKIEQMIDYLISTLYIIILNVETNYLFSKATVN